MTKNTKDKKFCPKCDRFWPRDNFYKNKSMKDGLSGYCIMHMKAMNKAEKQSKPDHYAKTNIRSKRLKRFNITDEQYDEMLAKQNSKCVICEKDLLERIAIDHNHSCCEGRYSCGKCVRGILCTNCNLGLGNFKDNPKILIAAAKYLNKYTLKV